ncbi:MAG: ABC transporter permease subunit [Acidobacteria bacterium]|nr:MAG: ABC transporter permease subunit [Acidobacteriota bacterium]
MPEERRGVGPRGVVLIAIALAGVWAAVALELAPQGLIPSSGGLRVARDLLSRAVSPALSYEAEVPPGTTPLLLKAGEAAVATVTFAAAASSLALAVGLVLGFLGSSAWWAGDAAGGEGRWGRVVQRGAAPALYGLTRLLIAFMRSIHELVWAVLFLAAFGLSNLSAVIAIAIPYAGTFAKVFSELIDEAPRDAAHALRAAGAPPSMIFLAGLLPRALPDMSAYAFYRFECALRSSAVLGFFGFPTLGYYLAASFENLHYGEVWTYLYALLLLVIAVDRWSGALRRRFVA